MSEERKTEITMKTECRKNSPIICKDLLLVREKLKVSIETETVEDGSVRW